MRIVQPYHVVEASPWPLTSAFSAFVFALSLIMKFNGVANSWVALSIGISLLLTSAALWWRDVVVEGTYQGKHTGKVKEGLKLGVILFFISECCLFASFFWAYFHASLSPNIELGSVWPPAGITIIDPWGVPILNLVVLLSSGAVLTWAHEKLIGGQEQEARFGLVITVALGIFFLFLQFAEFSVAPYTMADSVYGSAFFIITTCHGLHVIIGASFLAVGAIRLTHFTKSHHLGLEAAIWYWHVVDLIFLFVFAIVYWWGSQ